MVMLRYSSVYLMYFLFMAVAPARAKQLPSSDSVSMLQAYEDTLKELQYEKIMAHTTDRQKLDANRRFTVMLQKALSLPGSFNYPFDSLTTIGKITSEDKQLRIFTWDVPLKDGTFHYSGFVQAFSRQGKQYVLHELQDHGAEIGNPRDAVYSPEKWLGMIYYKIIGETYENRKIYMLLAWQGYSNLITRKIIDVASLNDNGEPSFGMSVFKRPPPGNRSSVKRLIFQYSANAFMSLTYNNKKNIIVFDRLAPTDEALTGQYQYYAPSFDVDCIAYKGSGWQYVANIDARNAADKEDKMYTDPAKNGPDMTKKDHDYGVHPLYNPNH